MEKKTLEQPITKFTLAILVVCVREREKGDHFTAVSTHLVRDASKKVDLEKKGRKKERKKERFLFGQRITLVNDKKKWGKKRFF